MFRRILRFLAIFVAGLAVVCGAMYVLGYRLLLDGGGSPQVARLRSADDQAALIARHREAQRTQAPSSQPANPAPPPAPGVSASTIVPEQAPRSAPYWTDFRGPLRDGRYAERPIRTNWPASGLEPVWRQPAGGGYASFIVANGRAFTIEQRGADEVVAAYDVMTGREVWTQKWTAAFREMMGGDGPRATPTWHDGTVYALGATGELRALRAENGSVKWRTNILQDAGASNIQWGMSAAPLVVGEALIVVPGGTSGASVVAYDRTSGRKLWSALNDRASYASPMLVNLAGVQQILVFTATRLVALSASGENVLWEFPWQTQYDVNASQPLVVGENRVFISTGYGSGAAMIEVVREGSAFRAREAWRTNRMKNQFTSSVLHDGFIYGLDEAILACIDASTGELKWKGGRYGYGQVMLASGHLIVTTEGGELALVRATPERHVEVSRFAGLEGKTWNHPAMADGFLLVRNTTEMAAFDLRVH